MVTYIIGSPSLEKSKKKAPAASLIKQIDLSWAAGFNYQKRTEFMDSGYP